MLGRVPLVEEVAACLAGVGRVGVILALQGGEAEA